MVQLSMSGPTTNSDRGVDRSGSPPERVRVGPRELGALTRIDAGFELRDNVSLASLAGLESLTRVGFFSIYGNTALKSLRALSALSLIEEYLFVDFNTVLPTCEIERLVDHIGAANAGDVSFFGNDDTATCAP